MKKKIAHNGIGLCARWRLEAQKHQTTMKIDKSTAVEYSTEPPLAQSPCYLLPLLLNFNRSTRKKKNFSEGISFNH